MNALISVLIRPLFWLYHSTRDWWADKECSHAKWEYDHELGFAVCVTCGKWPNTLAGRMT